MIQCHDCEYFSRAPDGQISFRCDPFSTIKEPECLAKWQLLKLGETTLKIDRMVRAYEATLSIYQKLQPMQEKMFRHMERELRDQEDEDSWKRGYDDDETEDGPFDRP